MIVGYLRVSTKKQDLESQKVGIDDYCKKHNIIIDRWVEEKVSGAKEIKSRQIGKVIPSLKANDTLIVSEISRLGRSAINTLSTIETLIKRKVNLVSIKQNLNLNCSDNNDILQGMMVKMFVHLSALFAEMERDMIRQRTKEGMRRRKEAGLHIGCPLGIIKQNSPMKKCLPEMIDGYKRGFTFQNLADKFGFDQSSISRAFKKAGIITRPRGKKPVLLYA